MNYFDSDMSNSTITVVHFNGKEVGNLCLSLRARSHNICSTGWLFYLSTCQIRADMCFYDGESLVDGTTV